MAHQIVNSPTFRAKAAPLKAQHLNGNKGLRGKSLLDQLLQILMRRGDNPYICFAGLSPADGKLTFLQHTQKPRLGSIGISPISSRNSVPPSAWANRPAMRWLAPVKRALFVPEKLTLYQFAGIAAIFSATNCPCCGGHNHAEREQLIPYQYRCRRSPAQTNHFA